MRERRIQKRSIDSFASRRASMRFRSVFRRLTTAFRRAACRCQIWRGAGSISPARPAKRKFPCREPIDVADLFQRIGADDRLHVVLGHALVVNHTAPVEAEGEIVGVAVGVHIAFHIPGHVLVLGFHGFHIEGLLHGQQGGGLIVAGDDFKEDLVAGGVGAAAAEGYQDCVRGGLDFGPHHGTVEVHHQHQGEHRQ